MSDLHHTLKVSSTVCHTLFNCGSSCLYFLNKFFINLFSVLPKLGNKQVWIAFFVSFVEETLKVLSFADDVSAFINWISLVHVVIWQTLAKTVVQKLKQQTVYLWRHMNASLDQTAYFLERILRVGRKNTVHASRIFLLNLLITMEDISHVCEYFCSALVFGFFKD